MAFSGNCIDKAGTSFSSGHGLGKAILISLNANEIGIGVEEE
jgi:hypothetical protein